MNNDPVETHFTTMPDSSTMADILDPLIDEFECESVPTEIHRYVALDESYCDFVLTPLELFMVNAYLYGVEKAVK